MLQPVKTVCYNFITTLYQLIVHSLKQSCSYLVYMSSHNIHFQTYLLFEFVTVVFVVLLFEFCSVYMCICHMQNEASKNSSLLQLRDASCGTVCLPTFNNLTSALVNLDDR